MGGPFHFGQGKTSGLPEERDDYAIWRSFKDPDDDGWLLQEEAPSPSA